MKEILKRIIIKLSSTKLWLTAWSCFLISYIVIKNCVDFYGIALALCGVVLSYFAVNEIQKYLTKDK